MKRNDLLLIIDMQNVYMPGKPWQCPSMPEVTARIKKLLAQDIIKHVAFTRFAAPQYPVGTWVQYSAEYSEINKNRELNEIVEELRPYTQKHPVYEKSVYSSFKVPDLARLASQTERVLLCGVVAECCVLATMMEGIDLGCKVIYLEDCISGQTEQNEQSIRKVAESFSPMHVVVMESEAYSSL